MRQGLLGNTLRNWDTVEEALAAGINYYGIREIGATGGGKHQVSHRDNLIRDTSEWSAENRRYLIDEAAPDSDVCLQGELVDTPCGREGYLGIQTGCRMRESIARGLLKPVRGLTVKILLEHFLDPGSYEDINSLLELFPEHTIEFASYPYFLGKIPRRNTVIWEVRFY